MNENTFELIIIAIIFIGLIVLVVGSAIGQYYSCKTMIPNNTVVYAGNGGIPNAKGYVCS